MRSALTLALFTAACIAMIGLTIWHALAGIGAPA